MPDITSKRPMTVVDALGGVDAAREFFDRLVDGFYAGVVDDVTLRPMYPDDLTDSKRWLSLFLLQYFGGPTEYMDQRGHPRLRMRHAPFVVDDAARVAWLQHMLGALQAENVDPAIETVITEYFEMAAQHMVNHP